jgi:outer membrane receptor protein involved in Fe transport
MTNKRRRLVAIVLSLTTVWFSANLLAEEVMREIIVTSERRGLPRFEHIGNAAVLDDERILDVKHAHIHELLTRIPGVWVTRASGQESLTAIRSPVLTGAGSCGAFLTLEDGIPSRPSGFCNVNQLFELNTELAESIEVVRGPGNALYGSNALHGIINVRTSVPRDDAPQHIGVEIGSNDFLRVDASLGLPVANRGHAGFVIADDGGFRDASGYRQAKGFVKIASEMLGGDLITTLSISDLDQETAGFIIGENAYADPALNRQNLNPEAFREASSQRLSGDWRRSYDLVDINIRPFFRHSDMQFLQHFLPGQPLEENGHVSAGALLSAVVDKDQWTTTLGMDIEWADVFLRQSQMGPTEGSAFLQETRPEGKHYDYDVTSIGLAPYVQTRVALTDRLTLSAGLRAEYLHYEYNNKMLIGNTRDDGTECGFGGCLYSRPADRSDSFTNLAPKVGALFELSQSVALYANLTRGFRAPQMTELYRLQSGQEVSDLSSEEIDSLEIGIRLNREEFSLDSSMFAMKKRNSVFRDANGFNVDNGRSVHRGIEASLDWRPTEQWGIRIDATYTRHEYDFDTVAARGETFVSGRDVDTAPRWLGSAEIEFAAGDTSDFGLQWTGIGRYFLDAENQFEYPGHDILNLRARFQFTERFSATARVNNLTDKAIADRADYAFGNYRYFPGRGREFFLQLRLEL